MSTPTRGAFHSFGRRLGLRFGLAILAAGASAGATWNYREAIFNWLLIPGGDSLSPFDGLPVFTAPTAMMAVTIGLVVRAGIIGGLLTLQVGLYTLLLPPLQPRWTGLPRLLRPFLTIAFLPIDIWTQVRAAGSTHWRCSIAVLLLSLDICFVGGAAFAYYVMLPVGIPFLLNFAGNIATPLITINEYLDLLFAMMFWLGVVFELPIAMFLLAKLRIAPYSRLRRFKRRYVTLTAFIMGAILTPTVDPINMTMVAVPIILLWETGLFLAWLARPNDVDYMGVRKCGHGIRAAYWWLYGLPGAALYGIASGAGRAWRRVRHGKRGVW